MNVVRMLHLSAFLSLLALVALAPAPGAGTTAARAKAARPVKKPAAGAHAVVPFIADDLDRALADARKSNRPLFVESWAPW